MVKILPSTVLVLTALTHSAAFLAPSTSVVQHNLHVSRERLTTHQRGRVATMVLGAGLTDALFSTSWLMAATSRLEKFVPDTLADMAGDIGSDAITISPDAIDAASQAVEEVGKGGELPPPYLVVVIAAAAFLLAGAQQLSLGNVFDEEAKTAGSTGAAARKMNMRNRSFFKKK